MKEKYEIPEMELVEFETEVTMEVSGPEIPLSMQNDVEYLEKESLKPIQ